MQAYQIHYTPKSLNMDVGGFIMVFVVALVFGSEDGHVTTLWFRNADSPVASQQVWGVSKRNTESIALLPRLGAPKRARGLGI